MNKTINETTETLQEYIRHNLEGFSHQEQAEAYSVLTEYCNAMWMDEKDRDRLESIPETEDEY